MINIKLCRQDVERIIELLEREPDMEARLIADGLRSSVGWKPQVDDAAYIAPQK